MWAKRWLLRQPLVQFFLVGIVLYAFAPPVAREDILHLDGDKLKEVDRMAAAAQGKARLDPTSRDTLLAIYMEDELLFREGRRLRLDRGDGVVRKRVIQKMRFLIEDIAEATLDDSETELRRVYDETPEKWASAATRSLLHIFFNQTRRGLEAQDDARSLLAKLRSGEVRHGALPLGDASPLPRLVDNTTKTILRRQLGAAFAEAAFKLPTGSWQGPLRSAYGWHLVWMEPRTPRKNRSFQGLHDELRKELLRRHRKSVKDKLLAQLAKRFDARVEGEPFQFLSAKPGGTPQQVL